MSALEQAILSCVLNACWQLPLMLLFCLALPPLWPNATARVRHWLWLLATALAALLPAGGLLGLYTATRISVSAGSTGPLAAVGLRPLLALCAAVMLWRIARLLFAVYEASRLRRRSIPFGMTDGIEIRITPPGLESAGPLLIGLRRPVILVPRFLTRWENSRLLEAVLAHELAHVQRRDMLTLAVSELALLPLAFHPASSWLRHKLSETRELACDEQATRQGFRNVDYARCLVEVAGRVLRGTAPVCALGIADGGMLERRVRALLDPRCPVRSLGGWRMACAIMSFVLMCDLTIAAAQYVYLWISATPSPQAASHDYPIVRISPPPPPPPPRPRP